MSTMFRVIALSSIDPDGRNTDSEPELQFPDALKTAEQLHDQGKAYRVHASAPLTFNQRRAFEQLGALL